MDNNHLIDNFIASYLVFLGGVCGNTIWRTDAMKVLRDNGIKYFNPQCAPGEWNESMCRKEEIAKEKANVNLFVIDHSTDAIKSMLEVVELMSCGSNVVLVLDDWKPEEYCDPKYITNVNRGRNHVRIVANKNNVVIHDNLKSGLDEIINMYNFRRERFQTC
jgi:hypothetical protein|tara:strand:+ start:1318 stop:1803 length:486 start_codon:yes stop_codon:yes gene_type:complete